MLHDVLGFAEGGLVGGVEVGEGLFQAGFDFEVGGAVAQALVNAIDAYVKTEAPVRQ